MKAASKVMIALVCVSSAAASSAYGGIKMPADAINRTAAAHDAAMTKHYMSPAKLCNADLRSRIPTCVQQAADWCWATGLAEFSFYYNKTTGGAANCTPAECAVVNYDFGDKRDCCPNGKIQCAADGQSVSKIVKDATGFIGIPFKALGGPPSEDQLIALLQAGTPVMPIITWYKQGRAYGGHALMVSGCKSGDGPFGEVQYYLHDPEYNKYEAVSFGRLMFYSAFNSGKWTDTIHA